MRLILRLAGTWLLGIAVVLLIIDGTRSLGANAFVFTPFGTTWGDLHAASLAAVRDFFASRFFGALLGPVLETVLGWPGWAVIGVPAILIAIAGRTRSQRLQHYTEV